MNTKEQPTILPWHREAAKRCLDEVYAKWTKEDAAVITKIIADHDPAPQTLVEKKIAYLQAQHAETVRLLEEAFEYVDEYAESKFLRDEIRAHLAAMKGTQ